MEFNEDLFRALIKEVQSKLNEFSGKLDGLPSLADAKTDHWYIPSAVKNALKTAVNAFCAAGKRIWRTLCDIVKGIFAPIVLAKTAWDWNEVKKSATSAQAATDPNVLSVNRVWKGTGQVSYGKTNTAQNTAAKRIGDMGSGAALALMASAAGGFTFYAVIGALLTKLIEVTAAVAFAIGTVVYAWAGIATETIELGIDAAAIWGAVAALTALLGAQATALTNLKSIASDVSGFPHGQWPDPLTSTFSDSSVLGGTAPWSIA
ncbi:hypothetical protein ACFXG4_39595 [Nocardia sp. NPDC059246]|uniref:hypothetical protein n=1 Tax=unclassified Nocardia TaxID=2637762 RepID=UPI0036AD0554